ncbi:hypothetical protein HK104_010944 [Borealophlyctis nickersoniae]|nr:hypothetical protein HK104_010944 [Borealophlyctis nickersoniae]
MAAEFYHRQFVNALIAHSGTETFEEAKVKWKVTGVRLDFPTQCICTHPITENCIVQNVDDGRELIIGTTCIKQFLPEEERLVMEQKMKDLKNKTRKCGACKKRYKKEGAKHEKLCNICLPFNNVCACGEVYYCEEGDKHWKDRCGDCYETATGRKVKGNHSPVNGRGRKTHKCKGCGKKRVTNKNYDYCGRCYAKTCWRER